MMRGTEWARVAAEPQRYGFHATLKAPFRLAGSIDDTALRGAIENFARDARAIPTIDLVVRSLGDFVALVPRLPSPALQDLAAACVRAFDSFRAPLSQSERARRMCASLGVVERAHLERWGYPYVLDRFRFHMTLTGRLDEPDRRRLTETLQEAFADAVGAGEVMVDCLSLLRQTRASARFHLVGQWPLMGQEQPRGPA